MTNKKIKNAGFNLQMQAIIKDNWRFLAGKGGHIIDEKRKADTD